MPVQNFDVEGLADLEKKLLALGAKTGLKTLRKAGRKAMQPVKAAAVAGAHEDTGDLKAAITVSTSRKNKSSRRAVDIRVGATKRTLTVKSADGTKTKRSLNHVAHASIAQEYGTSKQAADPFLRPALEDNATTVINTFKTELADAIHKAVHS